MKKKTVFAIVFLLSAIGIAGAIKAERIATYCFDNNTLTTIDSEFVYNGTQWGLVIAGRNITCSMNVTCNNNSFFGPTCDPPLLQQPLWLILAPIGILVFLGIIYKILKKVF